MPVSLLDTGLVCVTIRYVKALKKGAPLSYYRRIPADVRDHYPGKTYIRLSLRTRDVHEAARKAERLAAEHDALWNSLRSEAGKDIMLTTPENQLAARALLARLGLSPGDLRKSDPRMEGPSAGDILDDHFEQRYGQVYAEIRHDPDRPREAHEAFWSPVEHEAVRLLREDQNKPRALLSDALAIYLAEHDKGEDARFAADARRAISHVVTAVGDFPLTYYERRHASKVRDALIQGGNRTATVRRRVNSIKAVFNKGLLEFNLRSHGNPFEKLQIARESQDARTREPFTTAELVTIAEACRTKNDDIRHIVALQADTGARLGEVVGLRHEDVVLEHAVPHIRIRPYPELGRTLKTTSSERDVPLIGEALWAAEQALAQSRAQSGTQNGWLFPRYAADGEIKATHASQTINKWLSKSLGIPKTSHSFRHAMRDRLRHVGVSEEFQNLIGGWGSRSVGQGYGQGYLLEQLQEQLIKTWRSQSG